MRSVVNDSRRQKRISSLIKEELSRLFIEFFQTSSSGLITITRVEMSKDLKTAYVFLSLYGCKEKEKVMELLEKRKGMLRKSIATKIKLKYNPLLIFSFDQTNAYQERINKIIEAIRKNERESSRSNKKKNH